MSWDDLIGIAETLYNNSNSSEASKRSAINRAYYAARNLAKEILVLESISHTNSSGEITHSSVIKAVKTYDSGLGIRLETCYEYRCWADYFNSTLHVVTLDKNVEETIQLAKDIRDKLHQVKQRISNRANQTGKRTFVRT